jgi:acetyltransferase
MADQQQQATPPTHAVADLPTLVTRSGIILHIRLAHPGDEPALKQFFAQVTPDDLRFRFLDTIKQVADEQIATMTGGDAVRTFLATNVEDELIAVASLIGAPGEDTAEVALSVAADWKHLGVSWTLLEYVLACAKAKGFKLVSSLEAGENREAIKLEREMGFIARLSSAAPVEILVSKSLSEL